VCDFGLSKQRRSQAPFVSGLTSHCGTLPWTAPELLSDPGRASEKVDIYSFSVLMWELWTGLYPYADMREQTIMYGVMLKGLRPDLPEEEESAPGRGEETSGSGAGGGEGGSAGRARAGASSESSATTTAAAAGDDVTGTSAGAGAGGAAAAAVAAAAVRGASRVVGRRQIPFPGPGWRELMVSAWEENPVTRPDFDEIVKQLEGMLRTMDAAQALNPEAVTPR
jgi:serine/threonine protein kinase